MTFHDRTSAGRALARRLVTEGLDRPVVVAARWFADHLGRDRTPTGPAR